MKKHLLILFTALAALTANAQGRGIRIGYIDMEYILEKVPDYAEAKNQLEQKAQKWKQEIEAKKNDIVKLKESLKAEKVLLTKELIEEREEDITHLENELLQYQEKRFGPKGDLMSQKAVLVKPIQDQVFTAVQEIADKKYDFIFDKSSDLTMLYAAERHDISDQVVRRLTRASRREQLSNKELKKIEAKEAEEDKMDDPDYAEKVKKQEDKKTAREETLEKRKADRAAKREADLQKREQERQERLARRNGTAVPKSDTPATNSTSPKGESDLNSGDDIPEMPLSPNRTGAPATTTQPAQPIQGNNTQEVKTTATDKPADGDATNVDRQNNAQEERQRRIEERRKEKEERDAKRQKTIEEREAAKVAREAEKNKTKE